MKLRDSFISLKHISNELNISLSAHRGDARPSEIIPSDYESGTDREREPQSLPCAVIADANIKMIDKQTKTGTRVRNLKKSMLNDNKLIKLRNKLLRRSKSSVGISTKGAMSDAECASKEESQNKENELPKHASRFESADAEPQPLAASPIKLMSPNRNRVKMGTRVFSSQFLNKSFDNIFNTSVDVYRFDDELNEAGPGCRRSQRDSCSHTARSSPNSAKTCDEAGRSCDDGLSLKSTSLSSLYFSEKMSEKFSESPFPSEAYVIRKCSA